MWLGRTDRWSRSEGDRVIKVKLSNHLVHLVWIMSHSCCTTILAIFAEKEELNNKNMGKDAMWGLQIENSCANEFNYLLLQPPWRHTVCPCFRLYILPPPLLSLHLPMQLSTESQSFSIGVIMFLGGRIMLKDSTCRDLYIISWINALYITAMVKLAHAGQVFVYMHVHTCKLKGVATIGIIMPEIVSISDMCICCCI